MQMTEREHEALGALRTLANYFSTPLTSSSSTTTETEKPKRGRKPKAQEETFDLGGTEDEEQLDLPLGDNEEGDDSFDGDEESEEEAPKKVAAKKTAPAPTLKDVIAALKAYPNRDRAVAILKGFGAKNPQTLKEKDYAPLLLKLKK